MYWNSKTYLESKAPYLILMIHILIIGSMTTQVQFLTELSLFLLTYLQPLLRCLILITGIFYCLTAFQDPGFIKNMKFLRDFQTRPSTIQMNPSQEIIYQNPSQAAYPDSQKLMLNPQQQNQEQNQGQIDPSVLGGQFHSSDQENEAQIYQSINSQETPNQTTIQPEIVLQVRYCVECRIQQPLRAKHCNICNSCVAMFDHHCPWIGICVGQKNRRFFLWYLFFQSLSLWVTFVILFENLQIMSFEMQDIVKKGVILADIFFVMLFGVMTTALLAIHSLMVVSNLTLREIVSWNQISYLKNWPPKFGSPFSRGVVWNTYYYCFKKLPDGLTVWSVPSFLPNEI